MSDSLSATLATLKEHGLLDRVAEIAGGAVKFYPPAMAPFGAPREPFDEHKSNEAREQRQAAWERRVSGGQVARFTDTPETDATRAVPPAVKNAIRAEREAERAAAKGDAE